MIDFTQADRDEMRGTEWMRALPVERHAALPIAVDGGQHQFRSVCRCGWSGRLRFATPGSGAWGINTELWLEAGRDADEHNAQYAEKETA